MKRRTHQPANDFLPAPPAYCHAVLRLVELLREHRPVLSYRVKEEAGLLILVAYHRHGSSSDFLLETAEAYFRERDCGGFLFLCRMQASINAYDEYPHLNGLCNRLA